MANEKDYSAEATAIAATQLTIGLMQTLVDRKILTEEQVNDIFIQCAVNQRASVKPANQEAADLLEWMTRSRSLKWR